ncbi:hypothetical protein MUK70_11810 [Dyadobacter chenwenxiniae]|uniref:Uncharacterized protein n=1 Tax=Dyadobacter chenwenxiniae TaxID=2906456 RepID=A0A9X1PF16_9BACT|nr:hypothetical protein [Dyadobacter chenwenxiniae]MCF0059927.1 hypothetical protein [Dyadobacter chenwenxiniae]UON85666.1 hypothetical protein MUK70_11810 [Dyadobacter chenwenxiniae]
MTEDQFRESEKIFRELKEQQRGRERTERLMSRGAPAYGLGFETELIEHPEDLLKAIWGVYLDHYTRREAELTKRFKEL